MSVKVSVVIPAYNAEPYVAQTIESLLGQDLPGLEVVAVDDGSTDGTAEVLARYSDRVVVHRQPNAGQSAALATGWDLAGGDLLGYLSADDRLKPGALRRMVETLEAHPEVVLAYPDFDMIDAASRRLSTVRTQEFSRRALYGDLVCLPGPGAVFRRTAYEQAGPWRQDLRQMPDLDFYLRLGLCGDFRRVPEVLAEFRMHAGSTTYRATPHAYAEEPIVVVDSLLDRSDLPDDVVAWGRRTRSNAHLLAANVHARAGRAGPATRHLVSSGAAPPTVQTLRKAASVGAVFLEWRRERARARRASGPGAAR